ISDGLTDPNGVYQVRFFAEPVVPTDLFDTSEYEIFKVSENRMVVGRSPLVDVSPLIDGFVVEINNVEFENRQIVYNPNQLGYIDNAGSANETFNVDPTALDGVQSNWVASIELDSSPSFAVSPDDYELRWVNPEDSTYTPPRTPSPLFVREPIPIFGVNVQKNAITELWIEDGNGDRTFGPEDVIIIAERGATGRKFRHRISFSIPDGESSIPPSPGDALRISVLREFATGDMFQFTIKSSSIGDSLALAELADVAVVPNPYIGASEMETRAQVSGRGERRVQFINLPLECTIRIFNLRGELVKTLRHNGSGSNGAMFWDLQTEEKQDVAYGVYVFHVEAPGIGEHVGKFALVK
ncbi:MAG: hypothetical protein R3178_04080, partial [Rhodothermales bacterium]|nr:hypothetical protein [Rhodothermales bacterium]